MKPLNILISPDAFKGTLSSKEAADAIQRGINMYSPNFVTKCIPIADGGEGTLEVLVDITNGHYHHVTVHDPLGRKILARYGVLGTDEHTCVIEMAEASGLTLVREDERNPHIASTFGTGELILDALNKGFRKFILAIGGSATNDCGIGMLKALGVKVFIQDNVEFMEYFHQIKELEHLQEIDESKLDKRLKDCEFIIASDVTNPLLGEKGATRVFGPQKGIKESEFHSFEKAHHVFANYVQLHKNISLHNMPGSGAAGGLGSTLLAYFNATSMSGVELVLKSANFEEISKNYQMIITGEGKSDKQTLSGKAPFGIAQIAKKLNKEVTLISGWIDSQDKQLLQPYFHNMVSVVGSNCTTTQSLQDPAYQLSLATYRWLKESNK